LGAEIFSNGFTTAAAAAGVTADGGVAGVFAGGVDVFAGGKACVCVNPCSAASAGGAVSGVSTFT
jgi:hypothetical protein